MNIPFEYPKDLHQNYSAWTGSFAELVATANDILTRSGRSTVITERTARHYQHSNMLGRGVRQGKSAVFNFDDLTTLLNAKELVEDGLPIKYVTNVLSSPVEASSQNAINMVSQLMGSTQSTSRALPSMLNGNVATAVAHSSAPWSPPAPVSTVAVHAVAPGVALHIDASVLTSAPAIRAHAADQLMLWASYLKGQSCK